MYTNKLVSISNLLMIFWWSFEMVYSFRFLMVQDQYYGPDHKSRPKSSEIIQHTPGMSLIWPSDLLLITGSCGRAHVASIRCLHKSLTDGISAMCLLTMPHISQRTFIFYPQPWSWPQNTAHVWILILCGAAHCSHLLHIYPSIETPIPKSYLLDTDIKTRQHSDWAANGSSVVIDPLCMV